MTKTKIKEKLVKKSGSIEKVMLENFVEIQKVMVDLSMKLGDLTLKISSLLDLFENTARSMSKKDFEGDNKEITKKIDSLLEQNKTIAKGVSMMYENSPTGEQQKPVQKPAYPSSVQRTPGFSPQRFKQYPER
jgi:hypothetical protein